MVNVLNSLKMTLVEYKRVLLVTKKPGKEEFLTVSKVSAIGALLIGLIGFIVNMAFAIVRG